MAMAVPGSRGREPAHRPGRLVSAGLPSFVVVEHFSRRLSSPYVAARAAFLHEQSIFIVPWWSFVVSVTTVHLTMTWIVLVYK
jgi:hypothetical protein